MRGCDDIFREMTENCANGPADIDSMDPDDPDFSRQMRRPVEVKEDVRRMEERQRVKRILQSRAFRDELEELVTELQTGAGVSSVLTMPRPVTTAATHQSQTPSLIGRGLGTCIPIADIHGADTSEYDRGERLFRCKLASLYRLVDLFGWSHGIDSYITGRISQDFEHFLIAPFGMLHHEVTACSLVKVDMRGDVLDVGASGIGLGVNRLGFSLHAAVYASRPDIKCIVHLRCPSAVAVSALKCGLLPLCPETMAVDEVSYYEYVAATMDGERRDKLRRALGPTNKVLVLRNYGLLVGGETVEEAFWLSRNVMTGVNTQLQSIAGGLDNLALPSDEEKRKVYNAAHQLAVGADGKKWRLGEQDFEALMKHLDNVGYRTGYVYHEPPVTETDEGKQAPPSEVVVPPTVSSYMYSFEEDTGREATSPGKVKLTGKQMKGFKSDWLGHAKKEELDESALNTTKTSKWAPEDTSTPIKPDSRKAASGAASRTLDDADRSLAAAGEPLATEIQRSEPSAKKPVHNGDGGEALAEARAVPAENTLERESSKKDKKKKVFHIPSFSSKKK